MKSRIEWHRFLSALIFGMAIAYHLREHLAVIAVIIIVDAFIV